MRRVVTPELLDSDAGTPAEIAGSLADLRFINRWFGGVGTTLAMICHVGRKLNRSSLSLLEVAAGSGDVPGTVKRKLRHRGLELRVTLLDRSLGHLGHHSTPAVVGDALCLPFRDQSFDLISCGLFGHHLSPDQLTSFANESLRVCGSAVLINDLVRDPIHLALVYAGFLFYRSRLTRHDGPASVRAAYTPEEIRGLLQRTRARTVEIHRHYLFRMGVIAWKR
jgi:hypothetical protein